MEPTQSNTLIASVLWSAVAMGYWVYGKRQRSLIPFLGGAAMMAVTYLVGSALSMSAACILIIVATHFAMRRFE